MPKHVRGVGRVKDKRAAPVLRILDPAAAPPDRVSAQPPGPIASGEEAEHRPDRGAGQRRVTGVDPP